jgi:hypothetical protein
MHVPARPTFPRSAGPSSRPLTAPMPPLCARSHLPAIARLRARPCLPATSCWGAPLQIQPPFPASNHRGAPICVSPHFPAGTRHGPLCIRPCFPAGTCCGARLCAHCCRPACARCRLPASKCRRLPAGTPNACAHARPAGAVPGFVHTPVLQPLPAAANACAPPPLWCPPSRPPPP